MFYQTIHKIWASIDPLLYIFLFFVFSKFVHNSQYCLETTKIVWRTKISITIILNCIFLKKESKAKLLSTIWTNYTIFFFQHEPENQNKIVCSELKINFLKMLSLTIIVQGGYTTSLSAITENIFPSGHPYTQLYESVCVFICSCVYAYKMCVFVSVYYIMPFKIIVYLNVNLMWWHHNSISSLYSLN